MTPKEKAEELVEKYNFNKNLFFSISENQAKSCALIAVDEIIENGFNPQLQYNYWEEVKKEIEKL